MQDQSHEESPKGDDFEVVEVKDKAGATVLLRVVDGMLYPHDYLFDNFKNALKRLKTFQFRSDDVITFGFPRSGNHWSFEFVNMVLYKSANYATEPMYKRMISMMSDEEIDQLDQEPSPRVFKSHLTMAHFPPNVPDVKPRIIYMIRNPKDVFWSHYKFATSMNTGLKYRGEWDNFIELLLEGRFQYGSWFDHVLQIETFMDSNPECHVHVISYEQMKLNSRQEIERVAEYLGVQLEPSLVTEIVDKVQFQSMKSKMGNLSELENRIFDDGTNGILRKGEIGDWKNWFTQEQSEAVDRVFEEKLGTSKLGAIVKPFMTF